MPRLFIIAGPNGAGKTTYARRFLPREMACREFVNADLIAAGLSPFAPDRAAIAAGRIMLKRLDDLVSAKEDFSFETTLSAWGYESLLERAREAGYVIQLDFLWIAGLDTTKERVKERVGKGGHDIPAAVQERRFPLGIRNLVKLYRPLVHYWRLFDNTGENPYLVAAERHGALSIADPVRLAEIEKSTGIRIVSETPPQVQEAAVPFFSTEDRAALRAMRLAYADVVLENLRLGLPVIQWRQDRGVVKIPAELLAPYARRLIETNDEVPADETERLLASVR
ncbi:MAG TPA: AAA family ATPase [Opitutaceae bacterium]|jgi:predicted ABC-type ATPase|nr:AAA family ATPase [Opitutaceae bacterium]